MKSVEEVLSGVLKIDVGRINDSLEFHSIPEWDSFQHILLLNELENEFQVKISSFDIEKLISVKNIKMYLGVVEENPAADNAADKIQVQRGLKGVIMDNTTISHINGMEGRLYYRGYSIEELTENSSFEEVVYLLWYGYLPTRLELDEFNIKLVTNRTLPDNIRKFIYNYRNLSPLNMLRTVLSAFYSTEDSSLNHLEETGIQLVSQIPTIIAAHYAARNSRIPVEPDEKLSYSDNFLYMLHGFKLSAIEVKIFEQDLIIHMDHSSNASTLTARTVMGTDADLISALIAAICTFSGPLHGGAVEHVMKVILEIGSVEKVEKYVSDKIKANEVIMGFGHRVYKTRDPRAVIMEKNAKIICSEDHSKRKLEILNALISQMEKYSSLGLNVNVDYYAGVIYDSLEIPVELFLPIFIASRSVGWIAHSIEQLNNNILIRPVMNYVGSIDLKYLPVAERLEKEKKYWIGVN